MNIDNKYMPNYIPIGDFDVEALVVEFSSISDYEKRLNIFLQSNETTIIKIKKDKEKIVDLKDIILKIVVEVSSFQILKKIQGASIYDILQKVFNIKRADAGFFKIIRKDIFCSSRSFQLPNRN